MPNFLKVKLTLLVLMSFLMSISITQAQVPGAPTNLVVTPINTGGMIQFTRPSSIGGSAISNYEYSTDNGATWVTPSPAVTESPIIISSGLTNCTTYSIKLRAVNASGSGAASSAVNLTPTVSTDGRGTIWTARTSAANNSWSGVAYGNGLFVTVSNTGTGNRVMTSPDGITWTSRTSASNNNWNSVTYGNGLFVAVASSGTGNRVMTSPDGINWTSRTSAADNSWRSVTYGNGLFVAVSTSGTGNCVMTSPDGITWTSRTSAADNLWWSVTYGNGLFVAVSSFGIGNNVMTSPDGITWTSRTSAADNAWYGVTYGNGRFVAVANTGINNRVMTSSDGITWTARYTPVDNSWYGVTYGNGLFVAVAASGTGNRVMTSPDGITWTARTSAADNYWWGVTYGNGLFVAVAQTGTGNRVMTSSFVTAANTPVITSATLGSTTTVNFTQSASAFAPSITNYQYSTNNGSSWVAVSPATTSSPLTITGLSSGINTIMIRAVNSVGNSCSSNKYQNSSCPTASTETISACNSYSWHGTTYTTSNNTATWTGTNAAGCDSVVTLNLTINPSPTSDITNNTGSTVLTCSITAISVTATGGVSYSWSNSLGSSATASITNPGTYTVTVTGANGCTSTASITVTEDITAPTAGITNNTGSTVLTCTTTAISVTATGGTSYAWSNSLGTSANASITAPGTYTVTVTGANGCTSTSSITVTQNVTVPTAGITNNSSSTILTCSRTSIVVTATGGASYSWSNSLGNSATASITAAGTYTVTVTGTSGCTSTASITITRDVTLPTADITNNTGTTILTCATPAISVTGTGGVSYSWSNSLGNSATASITTPGTYTVTVTGANGCSSSSSITATQNITAPTAGITNNTGSTLLTCSRTAISVTATGDGTYSWNNSLGSSATASITAPGTYTVTVTASNGCTSTSSITVTQDITAPTAAITNNTGSTVLTCATTAISVTATGGTSYSWSNSLGSSAAASITSPGTYTVTVTGANGCTSTASITVTQNNATSTGDTTAFACGSFVWYGTTYNNSATPTHTFANVNGCDSVVTLHLIVGYANTGDTTVAACDSFTWYGSTYTSSANPTHTFTNASGCDSVVTAHITINNSTSSSYNDVACNTLTLPWGQVVTTSGDYVHTYQTVNGCDSVVTAHIVINYSTTSEFNDVACNTLTLPWGTVVTVSGNYDHTYQTVNGCDSVVTAHIVINYSTSSSYNDVACNTLTLPWSQVVTTTGDYVHTYQTVNGCDSVVTAHIVINYSTTSEFNDTACNTLTLPWSQVVTTTGDYVHTYQTVNGCDSVVTAHIVINYSTNNVTTQSACVTYSWNGTVYTQSGTYTYAYNNATGCASVDTLQLTINPLPASPTLTNTTETRCGDGTVTFSVNVVSGITYTWYDASTGGNLVATGATFTTPSLSQNTSYYVEATNTTSGCVAAARTTVNAVVNPLPATAVAVNGSRCGTGEVSISATVASGITVDWYAAASGGSALSTGSASFTTPSISSTTTYYAEARNTITGCIAASRVAVTATILSGVTVNVTNGSRCGTGTVSLSASTATNDQIDWYAASSGGTALATNTTTFTTPSISATTVYYAAFTSAIAGCSSASRTAVTATVNASPTPSVYADGYTTLCPGGSVTLSTSGGNAVQVDGVDDYVEVANPYRSFTNEIAIESWVNSSSNVWAGQGALILPNFNGKFTWLWHIDVSGVIVFQIQSPISGGSKTLSFNFPTTGWHHIATTCSSTGMYAYVDGQLVASTTGFTESFNNPANSRITLGLDPRYTPQTSYRVTASKFDEFRVWNVARTQAQIQAGMNQSMAPNTSGLVEYLKFDEGGGTTSYNLARSNANATLNNGVTRVVPSPVVIASNAVPISSYLWSTGATTSTIPVSTPGSYSVTVTGNNGCVANSDTIVIGSVGSPAITSTTPASRCATGTVTLSATVGTGETVDWYAAASGGTALATGVTSFTTPSISTTTIYYAQARNATFGCLAPSRVAVAATINALPTSPLAGNASRCGTGTVTISATPASGETIDWYAVASGGTTLQTNSLSYTTPSIVVSTVYYAQAKNITTGCVSAARTAVTATVNTLPTVLTTTPSYVCVSGTTVLSATTSARAKIDWYAASSGGTPLATGTNTFTTPIINGTTIFYAEARDTVTGCLSASRTAVTATVNSNLPVSVSISSNATNNITCSGISVMFTATPTNGGTSPIYQWKLNGNNVGTNGNIYSSSALANNDVVSVVMTSNATCAVNNPATSNSITTSVNTSPASPVVTNGSRCGTGTVALSASSVTGTVVDWYATATATTPFLTATNTYTTPSISTTTPYYVVARDTVTGCTSNIVANLGNSLNLDGTNDYVNIPSFVNPFSGNQDHSVEFYALYKGDQTGHRWIVWFGTYSNGNVAESIGYTGETGKIRVHHNSTNNDQEATTAALIPNVWTHVALVYTASNRGMAIYINGIYKETLTFTADLNLPASSPNFQLGTYNSYADGVNYSTKISLDELRIWKGARTQSQILTNMYSELNAQTGLVVAYHFNQGIASGNNTSPAINTLSDASGNNFTGNLNNFALTGSTSNWVAGAQPDSKMIVVATVNPLPTVASSSASTVCVSGTSNLTATASAGAKIDWYAAPTGGTALATGTNTFTTPTISATTTYYAEARDTVTGCISATRTAVSATVSALPNAAITNNTGSTVLTCSRTAISVTATGGVSYVWSNSLGTSANASITAPGTYTVTVTNASGCTATSSITITQDIVAPTAGITNNTGSTVLTCTTTAISVTATGGASYSWSNSLGASANASITAAGTYTVTVTGANGCTSTSSITITRDVTLPTAAITNNTGSTVLTCSRTAISVTATGGVSYSWSNSLGSSATASITTPGTYTVTVTGANGCTSTSSITATQNITAPTAGITNNTGSTVLTCTRTAISVTATGGASYSWSNSLGTSATASITAPGTYTVTVTGANGCTSTASITVTQNIATSTGDTTAFACNSFVWYGTTYNNSATPTHTFANVNGCDSVVTLHLTVGHANTGDTTAFACNSYVWYGTTYTSSATTTHTFTNASGCDSVVTLHLTIGHANTGDTTVSVCNSFDWYGQTYTTSGTPTRVYTNASGCDSVVTLHLTILQPSSYIEVISNAGPYTWHGVTYTISTNTPTWTTTNAAGCDSIVTLNLTITCTPNTGDTTASACNSFGWYGTTYTASGNYTHTLTNVQGCDSVLTLHLNILSGNAIDTTATVCGSIVWYGNTYTASGNYMQTFTNASGCDSVITLHLTVNTLPVLGLISGPAEVCSLVGSAIPTNYSIATVLGASNYNWTVPPGVLIQSGQGTNILSVTFTTALAATNQRFYVTAVSAAGCSSATGSFLLSKTIPNIPASITGPTNICNFIGQTNNAVYTCDSVGGATTGYLWTVPTGCVLVSGQGTRTILVNYTNLFTSGSVSVAAQSNCGSRSPRSLTVARTVPGIPVAITGPVSACSYIGTGSQISYSIAPVANAASYLWTVPTGVTIVSGQGTTTLVIKFNQGYISSSIKVRSVANCGSSADKTLLVAGANFSAPGPITGPTNACPYINNSDALAVFTIRKVANAPAYIWTVPAGASIVSHPGGLGVNDTIIQVTFNSNFVYGSNITVQTTGCGTSVARSISVGGINPSAPGTIAGPTNVCEFMMSSSNPNGNLATYTIRKVSGVSSYAWTAPANATIFAHPAGTGINDTAVQIKYNSDFVSGTVTVISVNGCGNSTVRTLIVSRLNPATPGAFDVIQTSACPNRVYTYTLAAMPANATFVKWTVPAGAVIVSGDSTTMLTVSYPSSSVGGQVTAQSFNNCAVSSLKVLNIKLPSCPSLFTSTQPPVLKSNQPMFNQSMSVMVYPNPTTTAFKLLLKNTSSEVTINVFDIQGRFVKSMKVAGNETLSLGTDLKAGTYFIEVLSGNEKKTVKVVKY